VRNLQDDSKTIVVFYAKCLLFICRVKNIRLKQNIVVNTQIIVIIIYFVIINNISHKISARIFRHEHVCFRCYR
jgi:hypothetical protein